MVSTHKVRSQQKRQSSQINKTSNNFVCGSNTNVGLIENETLESQNDGHYSNSEKNADGEISACQNEVIGINIDDRIRKAVDSSVKTVENGLHDAILTVMDDIVPPRVEMAVKSITGSSGHRPNSTVQNPDRRDFIGNTENTPLKSISNRLDVNIDQDRIDETRDVENF